MKQHGLERVCEILRKTMTQNRYSSTTCRKNEIELMTNEILDLMDQRRTVKDRDQIMYRRIGSIIKYNMRHANEVWIKERCSQHCTTKGN